MTGLALRTARKNNGVLWEPYAGSGCVLWLPGQDDAYSATIRDRSGSANNGTITGATWVRSSQGLWVLNFDGDDYVEIADAASLDITNTLTLRAWVKLASNFTAVGGVIAKNKYVSGTNNSGYRLRIEADKTVDFALFNNNASQDIVTTTVLTLGVWYRLVAVYTGTADGNMNIYINGVLDKNGSGHTLGSLANTLVLDLGTDDQDNTLKGQMGLWSVENTALSADGARDDFRQTRHLLGV